MRHWPHPYTAGSTILAAMSQVAVEDPYRGMARVGDVGQAEGTLRPAGKARFGSVLVDVVTEGEYLEPNCMIEVIERRGNRVVVRAARR